LHREALGQAGANGADRLPPSGRSPIERHAMHLPNALPWQSEQKPGGATIRKLQQNARTARRRLPVAGAGAQNARAVSKFHARVDRTNGWE